MAKIEQMTKIQDEISKCRAAFISMENRTYTPRISNDLFINNYRGMEVKGKAGGNVIDELYKKFKAT